MSPALLITEFKKLCHKHFSCREEERRFLDNDLLLQPIHPTSTSERFDVCVWHLKFV